ncbi:hypothetical protein [Actinopolymorpha alba]|uniref:hypothetical protein n=1 Tax=Actinopolymorpha alba TaxID=533267 RepID=UPI0003729AB0|nr:hypothetical protein [Actinopolymorpha alba]
MHTPISGVPDGTHPSRVEGAGARSQTGDVSRRKLLSNAGLVTLGGMMMSAAGSTSRARAGSANSAGEPVTLIVDAGARGRAIPRDFAGLSFEVGPLRSGNAGVPGYFFSAANTELVTLFRNAGINNLRVGGGSVDQQIPVGTGSDGYTGVDHLFEFAAAAGANVIYSVRLHNPSSKPLPTLMSDNAKAVQYISQRYDRLVSSYSIGNEPDWHSFHIGDPAIYETTPDVPGTAYPSYLTQWRRFADAIQELVPDARFSGPDTGNYGTRGGVPYVTYTPDAATGVSWTEQFAVDDGGSGRIKDTTQHHYVGGSPLSTTAEQAIDNMLSAEWVEDTDLGTQPAGAESATYVPYPWFYTHIVAPTLAAGLPCRLTEANDYLTGIPGASDAFASALWTLDYLHWWAARGVSGVNFHNKQWLYTDTITPALGSYTPEPSSCRAPGCGNYRVSPKGYGIKAFDLGARGEVKPVRVAKPPAVNVTAYAVGRGRDLYVTLINKTYGAGAANVRATIVTGEFRPSEAASITLTAGEPGDPSSQSATVGGAPITNDAPWQGRWTPLSLDGQGRIAVTVQATTATVVRIHR